MSESNRRLPNPDDLLRQVEAEEQHGGRGKLKVFLGYASGVGTSMRMDGAELLKNPEAIHEAF